VAKDHQEGLPIGIVQLDGCRCGRCWHEWLPEIKGQKPVHCAKCKSAYWDKPRQEKPKAKKAGRGNR
jgi:DNA-directed RNA polymerase subunit RPC12/RpoP